MRILLPIISFIGLALVIGAPLVYLVGSLEKDLMKHLMLAGTILWFASVPFWMGKEKA